MFNRIQWDISAIGPIRSLSGILKLVNGQLFQLEEAKRGGGSGDVAHRGGGVSGMGTNLEYRGDRNHSQGGGGGMFGTHAFDRDLMARNAAETRAAQVQSSMAAVAAYRAQIAAAQPQPEVYQPPRTTQPVVSSGYSEVPVSVLRGASSDSLLNFLSNLQPTLRSAGYSDTAITEITQSMQVLAKYNVLGLGLGFGLAAISNRGQQKEPPVHGTPERDIRDYLREEMSALGATAGYSSRSAIHSDLYDQNGKDGRFSEYDYRPLESKGTAAYASVADVRREMDRKTEQVTETVEVPENLIGVVLGRGGATLAELQRFSDTTMDVSRKGEFAPGTDNRLVRITGTRGAVDLGKRLVERRVKEEKFQRDLRYGPRQG